MKKNDEVIKNTIKLNNTVKKKLESLEGLISIYAKK